MSFWLVESMSHCVQKELGFVVRRDLCLTAIGFVISHIIQYQINKSGIDLPIMQSYRSYLACLVLCWLLAKQSLLSQTSLSRKQFPYRVFDKYATSIEVSFNRI
jgi:DMSO/TMAO reductase YedYZ heme-binding membrane subunit